MLRTPSYAPLVLAALLAMAGVAHADTDACAAATSSLYVADSAQTSFPVGYLSCAAADGSTIAQCADCSCRDRSSGTNGTTTVEYFLCVQGVTSCVSSADGLRTSCSSTSTAASTATSATSSATGSSTGTATSTAGSSAGSAANSTTTASPAATTPTPVTAGSSSGATAASVGDASASSTAGSSTSSKKNSGSNTKDTSTDSTAATSSDSTTPSGTVAAASNAVSGTGSSTTTNSETATATDSTVSGATATSSTSSSSSKDAANALGTSNGTGTSSSKSSSTVLAAGCAVAGIAAVALFAVSKKRKTNDDVLGTPVMNGRRKKSHGDTYQDSDTSKAAAMAPQISHIKEKYGHSSARLTGMSALDELDNFQLDIQTLPMAPPPPMPDSVPKQAPMTVRDLCKTATPVETVIPRESSSVANSPPDFRFSSFSVNESEMQRPGGFASMARMAEEDDEASPRQGPALTMNSLGDSGFSNFRDSRLTTQSARDTSASVNSTMSSVYDVRDTDASEFLRDSDENGFQNSSSSVQFERSPSSKKKRPSIEF